MEFEQHIYGIWPEITARERLCRKLAEDYHDMCDAFDKTLGDKLTIRDYAMMSRNAQKVLRFIIDLAAANGIDSKTMRDAIRHHEKR